MKTISKISAVLALSLSAVSFAADSQWELFTGGFGSLDLNTTASTTGYGLNFASNVTPTVGYQLGGGLELLVTPQFGTSGATGAATTFNILAGAAYNFGAIEDAVYIRGQAGLFMTTTAATSTSNFGFQAGVGKRFKVVDHVSFAPEAQFRMVMTTGTSTTIISIVPLQFSVQM